MVEKTTHYGLWISRYPSDRRWVRVYLRKSFWSVDTGTRSRPVAETGFYADGMSERDILESALREALRALADELA